MGDSIVRRALLALTMLAAAASALAGPTTVEQENGEGPDSFRHENAFNVFAVVEDEPSAVPGGTADEDFTYEFAASGVLGGRDESLEIQGTLIHPGGTVVAPDADGTLDFEDVLAEVTDPILGFLDYTFTNAQGAFTIDNASVINASAVTMTVTNSEGAQASDDFFVYTVTDAPDAVSGAIPVESSVVDLSQWTYSGVRSSGAFGSDFNGDAGATGTQQPDGDGDGSGVDLRLQITDHSSSTANPVGPPWSPQESWQMWTSPRGLIPYSDGATHRVRFTIAVSTQASFFTGLVEGRVRWFHGSAGNIASGNTRAHPRVNRPTQTGTEYRLMFDQLPLASVSDPSVAQPSVNENDITLVFEAIDFFRNYGGAIELESVIIETIPRSALESVQTLVAAVANFDEDTTDASFTFGTIGPAVTTTTAGSMTLSTPVSNEGEPRFVWGSLPITLAVAERGLNPFAVPAESGLIYRAEYDIDASGAVLSPPLPMLSLRVRTASELGHPRDTTETLLTPLREDGSLNPAYSGVQTVAAYHHFPSGFAADGLDPGSPPVFGEFAYGSQVSAGVALLDFRDSEGGSVTISRIAVYTIPEALLP